MDVAMQNNEMLRQAVDSLRADEKDTTEKIKDHLFLPQLSASDKNAAIDKHMVDVKTRINNAAIRMGQNGYSLLELPSSLAETGEAAEETSASGEAVLQSAEEMAQARMESAVERMNAELTAQNTRLEEQNAKLESGLDEALHAVVDQAGRGLV